MSTANDFKILSSVWLHNRVFRPGQEADLIAAGFTPAQKREQEGKGRINWFRGGPGIAASEMAVRLANERGVDLASLTGSGPGGRIYARDVPGGDGPGEDSEHGSASPD